MHGILCRVPSGDEMLHIEKFKVFCGIGDIERGRLNIGWETRRIPGRFPLNVVGEHRSGRRVDNSSLENRLFRQMGCELKNAAGSKHIVFVCEIVC